MDYEAHEFKRSSSGDDFLALLRRLQSLLNREYTLKPRFFHKNLGVKQHRGGVDLNQKIILRTLRILQRQNIVFRESILVESIILKGKCEKDDALKLQQLIDRSSNCVFLVYGHDYSLNEEIKNLLIRYGYKVKTLDNRPVNGSETIFERIEEQAKECMWAVAILSSDDLVESDGEAYFQARPNVFFETGFLFSQYGRSQVLIVKTDTSKLCTDLEGITFVDSTNKELIISSVKLMTSI